MPCFIDEEAERPKESRSYSWKVSPLGLTAPAVGAAPASLGHACLLSGENSGPRTAQAPLATVPASPWPSCLIRAPWLVFDSAILPGSSCAAPEWLLEELKDLGGGRSGCPPMLCPGDPVPSLLRAPALMRGTRSSPLPFEGRLAKFTRRGDTWRQRMTQPVSDAAAFIQGAAVGSER